MRADAAATTSNHRKSSTSLSFLPFPMTAAASPASPATPLSGSRVLRLSPSSARSSHPSDSRLSSSLRSACVYLPTASVSFLGAQKKPRSIRSLSHRPAARVPVYFICPSGVGVSADRSADRIRRLSAVRAIPATRSLSALENHRIESTRLNRSRCNRTARRTDNDCTGAAPRRARPTLFARL